MDRTVVAFHHIPKTGGSAVRRRLTQITNGVGARVQYGDRFITGRFALDIAREQDPDRAVIASGHWAFHPELFQPRPGEVYITWVRDPVEMVYSSWAFFQQNPDHVANAHVGELLDQVLQHSTMERYVDAVLASDRPFFPETVFTSLPLERFDFVGSAERMGYTFSELCHLLGITQFQEPARENVSGARTGYRRKDLEDRLWREMEAIRPWL